MNSVLGTILDPAADKILMTTLTVTLAIQDLLPSMFWYHILMSFFMSVSSAPLAIVIIGRDVLLSLSAFYIRYTSLPHPVCSESWKIQFFSQNNRQKTFARYWDFSIPSVEVHPTFISKVCQKKINFICKLAVTGVGQHCIAATSHGSHYNPSHPTVWLWSWTPRYTVRQPIHCLVIPSVSMISIIDWWLQQQLSGAGFPTYSQEMLSAYCPSGKSSNHNLWLSFQTMHKVTYTNWLWQSTKVL